MNIPEVWEDFVFCLPGRNSWQYEFGVDHVGALGCLSVRLGKAHGMVILACAIGLGSDNPVCVVSTIQFMPSAWDPCPTLLWDAGNRSLQGTDWLSFYRMNRYAELSTFGYVVLSLLWYSSNPAGSPCSWLSHQKTSWDFGGCFFFLK